MIKVKGTYKGGFYIRFDLDKNGRLICSYSNRDTIESYCGAGTVSTWRELTKADKIVINSQGIDDAQIEEIKSRLMSDIEAVGGLI